MIPPHPTGRGNYIHAMGEDSSRAFCAGMAEAEGLAKDAADREAMRREYEETARMHGRPLAQWKEPRHSV